MSGLAGWTRALLVAFLILIAVTGPAPDPSAGLEPAAVIGGRSWYMCAALAVGKWFFITNPAVFAGMAIVGGLACGFGF